MKSTINEEGIEKKREQDEPYVNPDDLCGHTPPRNKIDGSLYNSGDIVATDDIVDIIPGQYETAEEREQK